MRKNPWVMILFLIILFSAIFAVFVGLSSLSIFSGEPVAKIKSNRSILVMDLEGVIYDSKKFLKRLKKYRDDKSIRGVLIRVNSPGGVVGPSQELYDNLKKVRDELKKPLVIYSGTLNASGAYYASMGADKIVVSPGALMGSIGVVMEFANLEKLYEWAKINRYSITSGKYKDTGAEYRPMREDEKELFQGLIDSVYGQFRNVVKTERKLTDEILDQYADGRIMTGEQAVKWGFADQIGTEEEALKLVAEMAGLGDKYDVFEPPKERPSFFQMLSGDDEEDWGSQVKDILRLRALNQPLYLMPGLWGQ